MIVFLPKSRVPRQCTYVLNTAKLELNSPDCEIHVKDHKALICGGRAIAESAVIENFT